MCTVAIRNPPEPRPEQATPRRHRSRLRRLRIPPAKAATVASRQRGGIVTVGCLDDAQLAPRVQKPAHAIVNQLLDSHLHLRHRLPAGTDAGPSVPDPAVMDGPAETTATDVSLALLS